MRTNWNESPEKICMRSKALRIHNKRSAVKTAVFFPSRHCYDLKEALRLGIIDKNTFVVAIERDPEIAQTIFSFMQDNNMSGHVFRGNAYDCPLAEILGNRKIGYAFFDFCGDLCSNLAQWLMDIFADGLFTPAANVAFTFSLGARRCKLMKEVSRGLWEGPGNKMARRALQSLHYRPYRYGEGYSDNIAKKSFAIVDILWGCIGVKYKLDLQQIEMYKSFRTPMIMMSFGLQNRRKNGMRWAEEIATAISCC